MTINAISIHAPSRERPPVAGLAPRANGISIHAPSRERPDKQREQIEADLFQSTLPHGSDHKFLQILYL